MSGAEAFDWLTWTHVTRLSHSNTCLASPRLSSQNSTELGDGQGAGQGAGRF